MDLAGFFSQFKKQVYRKGEILISPQTAPKGIFYLKVGTVKQYGISQNGEELVLNIYREGAFFPVAYALNDSLPNHYFESLTNSEVFIAPKEDVTELFKSNPDIVLDLLKRIYKGLDGFFQRMEYLLAGGAKNKLLIELIIHAKRFGSNLRITEKELAAQSGITRETVSRELQKLQKKGLLSFKRGIMVVNNLEKLEKDLLS